jgi:hypothetical protein
VVEKHRSRQLARVKRQHHQRHLKILSGQHLKKNMIPHPSLACSPSKKKQRANVEQFDHAEEAKFENMEEEMGRLDVLE